MATERQKTCENCWRYGDYVRAGSPEQGKRIFQTLNRQGWNVPQQQWQDTPEEFHYAYDTQGRLLYAAFAMTPQQGLTGYTDEDPALRRALAVYQYDPAGRITSLAHYWQNYNSGYSSTPILKQEYAYDSVTRLRTAASFYNNPDSDGDFDLIRTETYDYDAQLDYLTEVDYNDGLPNEAQSWTYDAAGNRATDSVQGSGWSYDNLNRMTASPGYSYLHDILGNRTWRNFGSSGVQRYQWDALNRATSIVGEAYGARYVYRADGMRVEKVEGLTLSWVPPGEEEVSGHYDENLAENLPTSRYYYDGQMMVEDDYTVEGQNEPVVTVMRYGIGARGIDFLAKSVDGGAETVGFPLYDGHGNMIATLGRSENSPYFGVADLRSYDVWGSVRSGSSTGDPKQRYCANLGHVQDDESGLIYMRARYYEPWTGRFVSQDPAKDGSNWFRYCSNDPVNRIDKGGTADEWLAWAAVLMMVGHLVQKALDLSIKYLTPWLITMGIVAYVVDGMSKLPLEYKLAAGFGNIAAGALLKGTLDAVARSLQKFFTEVMMMQAPGAAYHMMSRAAASLAVYFIALEVYMLLIGMDA